MVEFHVDSKTTTIPLGRQGENLARVIYFDLAEMIEEYGEGTATLMNKRVGDDLPYKCTTTQSGDLLAWMPNSTDTAYAGTGKCELRWVVGNVLAKSITYKATITPSITADTDLPAPYQTWYESLLAEINEYTIASADIAKNKSDIAKNKNDISTCKTNIATNTAAITALNSSLIVPNNRVSIPNGSDINTYTTPGVYAVASDASAATIAHIPRAASGKLIVLTRGNNLVYIQQRYITTSSLPNEYVRNYNNGSFTSWELVPRQSDILEKSYAFTGINASSSNDLQQLGMIDVYGAMLAVFRVDGVPDGTSVYVVRRNSTGWQISTLYEGEASNTPVVDSNGILKLKSSSTGSTIHALGIVFAKWT